MPLLRSATGWRLGCYLGDGAVALAAWYGAVLLRVHVALPFTLGLLPPDRIGLAHPVSVLVVALQLLSLYFLGFYDSSEPRPKASSITTKRNVRERDAPHSSPNW